MFESGERVDGALHYPEYTRGCWGQPGHKLCWLCKFRFLTALARLLRRINR